MALRTDESRRIRRGRETVLSAAPEDEAERLVFGKTGWAIDFHGCGEIVSGLKQVLRGWDLRSAPAAEKSDDVRAVVRATRKGWDWEECGACKPRDWDAIPPRTPMRVTTDVHDAAIYWYLAENPQLLCMHGAAVQIGETLVCFPARGRAGKSTLMACLAARGHRIFADDVLGLDGRFGLGLGFLPRLRVPLAPGLGKPTMTYLASHKGPADRDWIYLDPGIRMAPLGERAPINGFVLLEREEASKARLTSARTADVLRHLIAENIIRQRPMPEIFDHLHDLARSADRHILRYADPEEAADLLQSHFA